MSKHALPTGEDMTPERLSHMPTEATEVRPVEKNGPKVRVNRFEHILDELVFYGNITPEMREAGFRWARVWRQVMYPEGRRDPLDLTPRGCATDPGHEASIDIRAVYDKAVAYVGTDKLRYVTTIVVHGDPTGPRRKGPKKWNRFCEGLSELAHHWGMV